MITRVCNMFGKAKNSDFFWTEISEGVRAAEYAVRGIVPTTANIMKEEIEKKTKSIQLIT